MNGHQPINTFGQGLAVTAWRCESCRRLYPLSIGSHVLIIEDFGSLRLSGSMRSRPRYLVRMVVCPPCQRTIENVEGSKEP